MTKSTGNTGLHHHGLDPALSPQDAHDDFAAALAAMGHQDTEMDWDGLERFR